MSILWTVLEREVTGGRHVEGASSTAALVHRYQLPHNEPLPLSNQYPGAIIQITLLRGKIYASYIAWPLWREE